MLRERITKCFENWRISTEKSFGAENDIPPWPESHHEKEFKKSDKPAPSYEEQIDPYTGLTDKERVVANVLRSLLRVTSELPNLSKQEREIIDNTIYEIQNILALRAMARAYPDGWTKC
jgi:hypothetical protein